MTSYKTILETSEHFESVKKSKFYGIAFPCESLEDFSKKLNQIKKNYPGANHYCYAYRIMDQVLLERYQDDKEPCGTAGLPILDVLKGQNLIQCALVVVRFFGGVKLGTGGLSRAYSSGAIEALKEATIISKEEASIVHLSVDYTMSGKIEYFIKQEEIPLLDTQYGNNVTFYLAIPSVKSDDYHNEINNLTSGTGQWHKEKVVMGSFSGNTFISQ